MSEIVESSLKPCPFCGGDAEIVYISEGDNIGGACVSCTECMASSNVEFEFKENFVSNWNRRDGMKIAGWMRAIKSASTPDDPGEWYVDFSYGDDEPVQVAGQGWVPLYREREA